jgi:cullin-associated NEDD8-dissociated protein 1
MTCPNVPKTFLNEAGCVASVAGACSADRFSSALFRLDSAVLRSWYTLEGRLVYAVSGLQLDYEPDPCAGGLSRWQRSAGACAAPTALAASTNATIFTRLRDSAAPSALVHDMTVRCAVAAENKGASITVTELDGTRACWRHVHPDEMNVYDFSGWSLLGAHPGNTFSQENGLPNPIAKFAEQGGTVLFYPPLHDMGRWTANKKQFPRLGRLGDAVDFAALPTEVQGAKVAALVGAASTGVPQGGVVNVCGSPGESMASPALGSRYVLQQYKDEDGTVKFPGSDYPIDAGGFKASVFAGVALTAPDQLRQRVAWALSQILVVTNNQVDDPRSTELFLQYYDIFVRNAFGNYGDVLREVSYSPAMGEMLSYVNGQSLAYSKRVLGLELFPDENYARELMQLFTIGLYELETDGTRRADGAQTYSNDDITTFARAWTGFALQARRGNVESTTRGFTSFNKIDPMRILGDRRDPFPKRNLRSGYIGDGLPLCSELGARPFLSKGARWSLLGASPLPLLQADPASFATTTVLRLSLNASSSALYRELCRPGPDGVSCSYPSIVELAQTLPCDGGECAVDQPRVVRLSRIPDPCSVQLPGYVHERPSNASFGDVCREPISKAWACPPGCSLNVPSKTTCVMQVGSGGNHTTALCRINDDAPPPVYYEYVRQPCVQLSFFSGGRRVALYSGREAVCANPLLPLAGEACCQRPSLTADQRCEFFGEHMTLATAEKRCRAHWPAAQNRTMCDWTSVRAGCPEPGLNQFFWSAKSCQVLAKVGPDGRIAIVHDVNSTFTREMVSASNQNWFFAVWGDNSSHLTAAQRCEGCRALPSGECVCPVQVSESQVFDAVPTLSEAVARLALGAAAPDAAAATGLRVTSPDGVVAYTDNAAGTVNRQTLFQLPGAGGGWFRNAQSDVVLPSGAAFRNPPTFMGTVHADARDVHHETSAVLSFFLRHSNTAPFVAVRLIQRLVTSNPSPRYVASVATAFRSGRFEDIGSGRYGCLLATVAAVLLDREARDASVDADPGAGLLREPLLKLLHPLRALQWVPHPRREIEWYDLSVSIGQQPHRAPSVFSFFKPESLLPGTALTSPEAEILTPPLMLRLLNGLMSIGKLSALTDCYNGLAPSRNTTAASLCSRQLSGAESPAHSAAGIIAYRPPVNATAAAVVDQLALLLTAGKLANATRAILEAEYATAGGGMRGLQAVQQLIFTAPEFHSSGLQQAHPDKRGPRVVPRRRSDATRPYKAIVYIFLNGGADSFSMLVPHSECRGGRDVYGEYVTARQNIAINRTVLLPIRPVPGTQVCDVMALHPSLAKVRDMYNAGDAAVLAGVGNMIIPLTKQQAMTRGAKVPVSLYAHNAQQMATMTLRPEKRAASGVLGRVADALVAQNFSVGSYTLEGMAPALLPDTSFAPDVVHWSSGVMRLDPSPSSPRIRPALVNISATPAAGVFPEFFASSLQSALQRGDVLSGPISNATLKQPFAAAAGTVIKVLARQLQMAARLMVSRQTLGTERDIFYATLGGFDTHDDAYSVHAARYAEIDEALESFRQEMVLQGLWNSTLVVIASEWGRCLTSNGQGTDHGWSGNYLALGGGVKGGVVLGSYPESVAKDSALDLGRGRMLPTTPWDAVWNAAAQWFGVASEHMDKVLPNRGNFNNLFQVADMFKLQ